MAASDAADVIDEDVVVFGAALIVAHDALENLEDAEGFDNQAGFLDHFASGGGREGFAGFDETTRKRPVSFQRFAAAFNEKKASLMKYESADAEQRTGRVAAIFRADKPPSL
jgi:hypothetical protein